MMTLLRLAAAAAAGCFLLLSAAAPAAAQCTGQFAAGQLCANSAASAGVPKEATLGSVLDRAICGTNNAALVRLSGTWSCLASGNNGVWITSGAGVPSISSTLPSAVQDNITPKFTQTGTGGVATTTQDNARLYLNAFQFIPTAEWAAIKANTSTTDVSSYINAAITAASSTNKSVLLPCGTYTIAASIVYGSNQTITGEGNCTIIKPSASMAYSSAWSALWPSNPTRFVFINSDLSSGNSNFAVRDLKIDFSSVPSSNPTHGVVAYKSSNVTMEGITCVGNAGVSAGNCVANVETTKYTVRGIVASEMENACVDQWQGSSWGKLDDIQCNGPTVGTQGYCVLITGMATAGGAATTSHISGKNIRCSNARSAAVWVQGGAAGSVTDIDLDVMIDGVQLYHGIRTSEAERVNIRGQVRNTNYSALVSLGEAANGGCKDCVFDLLVSNTNQAGSTDPKDGAAILLDAGTNDTIVRGRVKGSAHRYIVNVASSASRNQIRQVLGDDGAAGRYLDNGTSTIIEDCAGASCTGSFTVPVGGITGLGTGVATALATPTVANVNAALSDGDIPSVMPQGRLTLATGTPVMNTSQSAKTTVYYTPYLGRLVPLYNGTNFTAVDTGGELSQATTDTTKSPAAVANSSCYNVYVWSDGGTMRATRGAVWAATTTGAAAEMTLTQGIWLNTSSITNGPAALRATYVGSICSNGSAQIDWTFGSSTAGGGAARHMVWNMYNRVNVASTVKDTTSSWTSNNQAWEPMNVSGTGSGLNNRATYVVGIAEDAVDAAAQTGGLAGPAGDTVAIGVCVDSTTAVSGVTAAVFGSIILMARGHYQGYPGIGQHYVQSCQWMKTGATMYGAPDGRQLGAVTEFRLRM